MSIENFADIERPILQVYYFTSYQGINAKIIIILLIKWPISAKQKPPGKCTRCHQIAPFFQNFFGGHAPGPPSEASRIRRSHSHLRCSKNGRTNMKSVATGLADLLLCFHRCKLLVFSCEGSIFVYFYDYAHGCYGYSLTIDIGKLSIILAIAMANNTKY